MRVSRTSPWRLVTVLVSLAGVAETWRVWNRLEDAGLGDLTLAALPFLIGFFAGTVNTAPDTRIMLLWLTAGASGLIAALTIMSGTGFVLLAGMVVYLAIAWAINERERRSSR